MTTTRRSLLKLGALAPLSSFVSFEAMAEGYPDKPIHFVVPYPPGGASDVLARLIGQSLQQKLEQPVVIENRVGGNGVVAYQHVARAPADGYTILMGNLGPSAIIPSLNKKLPYDARRDFAPVTIVSWVPLMLVVNKDSEINSVQDLINKAKAHPGKLSYGIPSVGTAGHLGMELLKSEVGIAIETINYKGDAQALADVMGGHIQALMATVLAAAPLVDSGRVKCIAVTTPSRLAAYPQIPTVAESGVHGFEAISWGGILAPAATPEKIIQKLNQEIVGILKDPRTIEKFRSVGAQPVSSSPDEFKTYIESETRKWGRIIQVAKISVD